MVFKCLILLGRNIQSNIIMAFEQLLWLQRSLKEYMPKVLPGGRTILLCMVNQQDFDQLMIHNWILDHTEYSL